MAASKRFRIPTLQEMENADNGNTEPEPSFKRRKEFSTGVTTQQRENIGISKPSAQNQYATSYTSSAVSSKLQKHFTASEKEKQSDVLDKEIPDSALSTNGNKIPPNEVTDVGGSKADSSNEVDEASKGTLNAGSKPGSSNSLIVNTRQRGNPILKSVRNVPWEYGNIVPDYVMGQANCALFLSLRYHQLHPNYVHERLKQLGKSYDLRIMLVQVDVKEPHHLLKDLAKICLLADCTLILAFSPEEAGRYLETYKIFENKPAEAIMEKTEENFMAKFTDCMTRVKSVNKTDCATLVSQFGSVANIMEASDEDLSLCPGFGPQKAKRLHDIFHEPFRRITSTGSAKKTTNHDDGS